MEIKIIKTNTPKQKPDPDQLSFGKYFTDHMFTMEYVDTVGWHNPQIVPYAPISLDPSSMILHYGQGVFEGMKAYRTAAGAIHLFRPLKNFERMNQSNERICIPKLDENFLLKALITLISIEKDWIFDHEGTSLYIRPFVFATESSLGVHPSTQYKFMIILSPVGAYYPEGLNPVKITVEDEYVRAVRGGIGFTKAIANYAISLKGQEKAIAEGFTQVLWLDGVERKYIEEVGTMNVFLKINGEFLTPSLEGSILPGITRDSILTILKDWGLPVSLRKISIEELLEAQKNGTLEEAFGTGTAAVISPIGEFHYKGVPYPVKDGGIGEYSKKLYDTLTGIQYGKIKDPYEWIKEVK